ncbi:MAG: hypothetical protein J6Y29_00120 [Clostridiales bacterium]|nr:hypothetical protein [Clostridiales bacterium]
MNEFEDIIKDILENETVRSMRNYRQHFNIDCFEHSYNVAKICYTIAKNFNLDYVSIARAGMLHDLFLYDWRAPKVNRKGFHAFTHGKSACKNASELFDLSEKEKDMIIKHMWPVTPLPPKSVEGLILTFVDKYCAIKESIICVKKKFIFSKK